MNDNFDPNSIQDPALRQTVLFLMNQVEELAAKVKSQAQEIQTVRDENNRLKGEQAKPTFKPKVLSSEKERQIKKAVRKPKSAKKAKLVVNHHQVVKVDRAKLPLDAQFKGYKKVIVQDIALRPTMCAFKKKSFILPPTTKLM